MKSEEEEEEAPGLQQCCPSIAKPARGVKSRRANKSIRDEADVQEQQRQQQQRRAFHCLLRAVIITETTSLRSGYKRGGGTQSAANEPFPCQHFRQPRQNTRFRVRGKDWGLCSAFKLEKGNPSLSSYESLVILFRLVQYRRVENKRRKRGNVSLINCVARPDCQTRQGRGRGERNPTCENS